MKYFKKYFEDVENWDSTEVKVLCPFHSDTKPSASINTDKSLFHCWVCDIGYSEEQFISKMNNITTIEAMKLLDKYDCSNDWNINIGQLWADNLFLKKVIDLGLSEKSIKDLKLGIVKKQEQGNKKVLGIPVFYNNILVDVREYNLLNHDYIPKVRSNDGAEVGWIVPYDSFLESKDTCYILEGEKDMLIARESGLNAYTLTGGAGALPNSKTINSFKDKDIVICYDNDDAGEKGMKNLYKKINKIANSVKYIKIGDVVENSKEDYYDYITKYNGDVFDFLSLEQHEFVLEEDEKARITINEALKGSQLRKLLKSTVTITSEFADPYAVPTIVEFEKTDELGKKSETMFTGEKRSWFLDNNNMSQMLELIEASAKKEEVTSKLKGFVGIPNNEPLINFKIKELKTIYKSTVVDKDIDGSAQSLDLYSFEKLDVGGQYIIDYKVYPHPTKHQKLVAICMNCMTLHDTSNYIINKEQLKLFQKQGTIQERLDYLYESAKHYIAKHLNFDIWFMNELVFNSILDFEYDGLMRGALDVFILGDTQTGKSETASGLVKLYNFGHFLSLKTSTTVGLIGGSSKVDGSFCNTIGAIPRQHKRLAVLEEFSGARQDFIKTMTDIRSSNELRLARVSGELRVPCKLRMISISNPISDENGSTRSLNTFPNGVMPITELIRSAEDIARYDGFLLVNRVETLVNPFGLKLKGEPIEKKAYNGKINWVATREPENVWFSDDIKSYVWNKAEELNKKYQCNFPLFGTTTAKKLARFSVALASLIVNVDETYENIIVTKEIVDYVCDYLVKIYDGQYFRLNDYAREYREYSECTDKDVAILQKLYANNSTLFNFLIGASKTSRSNLASVSGMLGDKFYIIFNKLVANKFIKLNLDNVYPTDKFRKAYARLDRSFTTDSSENLIDNFNKELDMMIKEKEQ